METEESDQQPGTSRHCSFVTVQPVSTVILQPLDFTNKERSTSRKLQRCPASPDSCLELFFSDSPSLSPIIAERDTILLRDGHMDPGKVSETSSVTSTPTMVRSRPKIPVDLLNTRAPEHGGKNDLTTVIRTDWSKYRRKGKVQQGSEGQTSPVSPQSLPTTPKFSPVPSPLSVKSPPPEPGLITTMTRMTSIQSKLEKLKINQDNASVENTEASRKNSSSSVSGNTLCVRPGLDIYEQRRHSSESNGHLCSVTRGGNLNTAVPLRTHRSESAIICDTNRNNEDMDSGGGSPVDDYTHNLEGRQTTKTPIEQESRESAPPKEEITFVTICGDHPGECQDTPLRVDRESRLATLFPMKSTDSEASSTSVQMRPAYSLDKDSDDGLHVTEDEDSGLQEKRWLIDSSVDTEDEGLGGVDIEGLEREYRKPNKTITPCRTVIPIVTTTNTPSIKQPPVSSNVTIPKILVPTKSRETSPEDDSPKRQTETSGVANNGKVGNGRFLTHPPVRDRSATRETGSVDSNGLGSLREGVELAKEGPMGTEANESVVSLADSHMCPSESSDAPCYHDIVQDILSEPTELDKNLERKNSKTLKQKSKSDPCGETVDLPTVISGAQAHTSSSPTLRKEQDAVPRLPEFRKTEADKRKTKSDDVLTARESTVSKRGRISKVREIENQTLTSEDSSEEVTPGLSFKPHRKSSKKKHRESTSASKKDATTKGKTGKSVTIDSPPKPWPLEQKEKASKKLKSLMDGGKPATAPSTPLSLSPENTLIKSAKEGTSLTLPLSKKSSLTRSHSTASVFLQKGNVSAGARPKEFQEGHRKIQATSSHDFQVVPELSSSGKGRIKAFSAHFSPSLEPIFSQSSLSLFEGAAEEKGKRDLIVREFYSTEHQYVETLQMLVEMLFDIPVEGFQILDIKSCLCSGCFNQKYMIPMKTQGILDSSLVDDVFYKINEIYMHHVTFLTFLKKAVEDWNSQTTIGDVIYKNFSKQTVIENYVSFIENFPRAEKVLDEISTKSSFQKYIEVMERESKSKLPLKAHIVKPAQRIPRYELLLKRLLDYTAHDHPDYALLVQAEGAIHALALKINAVKDSKHEEDLQGTVKKLELLLITDLVAPDRLYLRHDVVTVMQNRKDVHCVWLFTDLVVISSVKRKSGTINRKSSLLLQSPMGNDFVENVKHKLWMKVPLDDLEIVQSDHDTAKRQLVDRDQLETDFVLLSQISDLSNQLKCNHQQLDETIRELINIVNKQLSEHQLKSPPPEAHKVDLIATTTEGVTNLTLVFASPDKRATWESMFIESKQKLSSITGGSPPEFIQALQITKTRAGMQFSCASPIEGLNGKQYRDVWVCNSDGYVGHMCLLSLQPEPIVTLNTPVPGCNSRILCICSVPAFQGCRRKGSQRRQGISHPTPPQIKIEESRDTEEDGYVSDSSSSSSEEMGRPDEANYHLRPDSSRSPSPEHLPSVQTQSPLEASMSSMWLGTEEGCILIFPSTENLKTTKCKIKVQQNAAVLCIVQMDQRVFVSLANGDIIVYQRGSDGSWDITSPEAVNLGTASSPVVKMLPVAGKLWCACKQTIYVISPITLKVETTFTACQEVKKGIQCMACSGQAVWMAGLGSSKVLLYHATTFELLLEVSVAQAVAQKLQTADDIIRQHKTACLRITTLLTCKELLWIGTSAGVILTLQMPKITPTTTKSAVPIPPVTGSVYGHTGHVRFLTSVEIPAPPKPIKEHQQQDSPQRSSWAVRRASVSAHTASIAARMLVISGGDGYEDFRGMAANEAAGRDDSTNHLLLWNV